MTKRCGKCSPCAAVPQRPCDRWVRAAVAKLKRELQSEGFARVLRDFDNKKED